MKLSFTVIIAAMSLLSGPAFAAEYIYRDLMANTLPMPKCESKADAITTATKPSNIGRYTQRFCQTQGYGWHLTEVKNNGKSVCDECSDKKGTFRCHLEDVVVQCKRLKPGSVGLIPGEG